MGEYVHDDFSRELVNSPEFRETVFQFTLESVFSRLNELTTSAPLANDEALRGQAVAWACYDWLHVNSAGMPYTPLIDGAAREDARFWAETAQPQELECYALAAIDKLRAHNAPFVSRQIKRLVAALWRRMSPSEQNSFVEWLIKDLRGDKDAA
jgi:hypothetical protein